MACHNGDLIEPRLECKLYLCLSNAKLRSADIAHPDEVCSTMHCSISCSLKAVDGPIDASLEMLNVPRCSVC